MLNGITGFCMGHLVSLVDDVNQSLNYWSNGIIKFAVYDVCIYVYTHVRSEKIAMLSFLTV